MEKEAKIIGVIPFYKPNKKDFENIRKYILELDSDKQKVKEMGQNSRQLFLEKYTREICTNQYIEMMQNVLNRRSDSHV